MIERTREAWFPWKKTIFVRGSASGSSERIALIVSTLALIISAAATVGTWRQTDLMKEQLIAADRNAGYLKISEALMTACRTIRNGPVRARKWKIYRGEDGRPAKKPIIGNAEIDISIEQREAYGNALEDLQYNLVTVGLYRGFSTQRKTLFFTKIIDQTRKSIDSAIDLVDNSGVELDYVRLRSIGEECGQNIDNAVVDEVGVETFKKDATSPELDPLTLKLLQPIPDATQ
ncbi:hypothetical protein HJB51_27465 [Rhizobium lentis]|uniref:hypothetical protein n=1 Tax=Rhizobium lentis TaxID=1138194 RepID=UPI001C83B357|nr:hypothetical protein [Rhizobium lentis]MBX4976214.1 hypothetical protein [Rhizobium lentis]MBX5044278.1 hypothetical protein [Rhizobium lentis]MBX5056779.1 hypothetical protein [Rhizobium lentis]MBX5074406.1 hypothetical protein [Rhizobium lentis]MBX5111678.1 hypothetical protein [Rhizobium lentis]